MNLIISFVLTLFVYVGIVLFLIYTLSYKVKPKNIKIENIAYIHRVIKPIVKKKEKKIIKKIIKKEKKVEKKEKIIQKSDISKSGEEITFDDIFENVDENRNDIKKIKFAKKDDIKNVKDKKLNLISKSIEKNIKSIKDSSLKEIVVSKNSHISNKKLMEFYKEVNIIWYSLKLNLDDVVIIKFSNNSMIVLYSNLDNNTKELFLSKLKEVDLSKLDGEITITFNVKEDE